MARDNDQLPLTMPLAGKLVFETDDLLATRNHLSRLLWPHSIVPTERSGQVRFRHCRLDVGRISINALHYGPAIRIDIYGLEESYLLLVLLRGTGKVIQGDTSMVLNDRNMYAFNADQPARVDLSHGQTNFTVRIPAGALREFVERESGKPMIGPFEFRMGEHNDNEVPAIRSFLQYLCQQVESGTPAFDSPIVAHHLERVLIGLLLTELPHNHPELLGLEAPEPVPVYIHRVEEFIAGNYSRPITLNQLCAAAAVSPRTLQTGFRRFRNATPMEYLRNYRLTLARTRLQSGPHHYGKNITEIASDCGFSHLSKFAECYRARFNETPSNTLKQGRAKRS